MPTRLDRVGLSRTAALGEMRGKDSRNDGLFSYVRLDSRIPKDHPLRVIRRITDAALASLSDQFEALYS